MPVSVTNQPTVNPNIDLNRPEARAPAGGEQVARVSSRPGGVTAAGDSPLSPEGLNTGAHSLQDLGLGEQLQALLDTLPDTRALPDDVVSDALPDDVVSEPASAVRPDEIAFKSQVAMGLPVESTTGAAARLAKVGEIRQQGAEVNATGNGRPVDQDLAAYEARLTGQLATDPTTKRALTQRQALSARAGQAVLDSVIKSLDEDGMNRHSMPGREFYHSVEIHRAKLDKAAQLLATVSADGNAGELEPVFEPEGGESSKDIKKQSTAAMGAYLGIKKPSKNVKAAATQDFLAKVDRFLDAPDIASQSAPGTVRVPRAILQRAKQPPPLIGPDTSPSGALTPDEKVALFIARTVEKSIDIDKVSNKADNALFKPMSDPRQVRKQVAEGVRQELRSQFQPIVKSITVPSPGPTDSSMQTYKSELTPAQARGPDFGSAGVLCSDAHADKHLTNLWSSRYQDSAGKTLFNGVRHGTVSAYGINPGHLRKLPKSELHNLVRNNLSERQLAGRSIEQAAKKLTSRFSLEGIRLRDAIRGQATRNRALELVKFNLLNNPQALEKVRGNIGSVDLEIPSIMLVTPDRPRRILGTFGIKHDYDELRMTREQDAALKALAREPVQVTIDTDRGSRTVAVNVKPLNFSFGVNSFALGKAGALRGWSNADAINRGSIERLVGDPEAGGKPQTGLVAEYLQGTEDGFDLSVTEQDRQAVLQLTDQIRDLYKTKAHHKQNNDPYALPARLALLTSKLGLTPAYNCKSGKDRTGQMDSEIKFLATRIASEGQAPRPGAELGVHERDLYRNLVLNAGNHEIQRLNTGHARLQGKVKFHHPPPGRPGQSTATPGAIEIHQCLILRQLISASARWPGSTTSPYQRRGRARCGPMTAWNAWFPSATTTCSCTCRCSTRTKWRRRTCAAKRPKRLTFTRRKLTI